jgi:hypothetical protein
MFACANAQVDIMQDHTIAASYVYTAQFKEV